MSKTTFSGPVNSINGFEINGVPFVPPTPDPDPTFDSVTTGDLEVTGESNIDGATIILANLPTADPEVVGQLWNNSGVLTVSAG